MRQINIILLLLIFNCCCGQQIKFQIKRVTICDSVGKIDTLNDYYLTNLDSIIDTLYNSELGTTFLPTLGKYQIHMLSESYTDFPDIDIKVPGLFIYTHYEPKIALRTYGMHLQQTYETCGKPIEGFNEDFYSNGNRRIVGNFSLGKPKDSLVTFYWNGNIQKRFRYLLKETYIEEFDSLSNLIKISHNSNKSFYLSDYKSTQYFENGKIQLNESSFDNLIIIEEYFSNGQLKIKQTKKRRTEYYDNGRIYITYNWNRKKRKGIRNKIQYDFNVYKKTYNEKGKVIEEIVYEEWGLFNQQPKIEVAQSDWIITWTKFENDNKTILAKDVSTTDFFKKWSD